MRGERAYVVAAAADNTIGCDYAPIALLLMIPMTIVLLITVLLLLLMMTMSIAVNIRS